MKKIFLAVAAACSLCSCSQQQPVTVTVTNPLAIDRSGEMVEVSMAEISSKLQLPDTAQVIVLDENDLEVPQPLILLNRVIRNRWMSFPAVVFIPNV